jgi:uncharacterized SAM-binding protein YcdF (DUF218 family)
MRRGWLWLGLGLLMVAAVAASLRRPLLTSFGAYLVTDEARRPADAIVVLSGSVPDRILEAVDLYQRGLAPKIILTREAPAPGVETLRLRGAEVPDRHDLNVSIATQLGVPHEAIITADGTPTSTRSEAELVVSLLHRVGLRTVLLVTSKLHSRRAGAIFHSLAGGRIEFIVCASPYDSFRADDWWLNRGTARRVVFEYQKLLYFQLWERWRPARLAADRSTP